MMNMLGMPWIPLASVEPHRCLQVAWFLYGWIEREHVLNATACADWWLRAIVPSVDQFKSRAATSRNPSAAIEPQGC